MTEHDAMTRALEIALQGWGRVSPNPLVGAVLLRDGEVVGEGFHAEFGGPHAEIEALASCVDARGATCVVTLEPCSHVGKTPACANALIDAGVTRVVCALRDPNPEAAGGLRILGDAGVEIECGIEERAARVQNAVFFHAHSSRDRPFVVLKVATSLDGYLADVNRRSQWISGPDARAYVHWLRAGFDAIAVGRNTAVEDDPALTVRGTVTPRIHPTRVVFTRTGQLSADLQVIRTAGDVPTIVFTTSETLPATERALSNSRALVLAADSLEGALRTLKQRGVSSILVEGGGQIASSLLESQLIDRIVWIKAPLWLHEGVPAFGSRAPVTLDAAVRWNVVEQRGLGSDTLLVLDRELCLQGS